uniref:Uncharacterized protein n=1 Tax=Acrobeloides nanus TaxID=290746 RepID=A0A914DFZ7_9BILA
MSTSNINVKEHEVATEIVNMLKRLLINPRLVANLETIEEEEEKLNFDQFNTIYVDESEYENKSDEDVKWILVLLWNMFLKNILQKRSTFQDKSSR